MTSSRQFRGGRIGAEGGKVVFQIRRTIFPSLFDPYAEQFTGLLNYKKSYYQGNTWISLNREKILFSESTFISFIPSLNIIELHHSTVPMQDICWTAFLLESIHHRETFEGTRLTKKSLSRFGQLAICKGLVDIRRTKWMKLPKKIWSHCPFCSATKNSSLGRPRQPYVASPPPSRTAWPRIGGHDVEWDWSRQSDVRWTTETEKAADRWYFRHDAEISGSVLSIKIRFTAFCFDFSVLSYHSNRFSRIDRCWIRLCKIPVGRDCFRQPLSDLLHTVTLGSSSRLHEWKNSEFGRIPCSHAWNVLERLGWNLPHTVTRYSQCSSNKCLINHLHKLLFETVTKQFCLL